MHELLFNIGEKNLGIPNLCNNLFFSLLTRFLECDILEIDITFSICLDPHEFNSD